MDAITIAALRKELLATRALLEESRAEQRLIQEWMGMKPTERGSVFNDIQRRVRVLAAEIHMERLRDAWDSGARAMAARIVFEIQRQGKAPADRVLAVDPRDLEGRP
jgi:hypothetical protein